MKSSKSLVFGLLLAWIAIIVVPHDAFSARIPSRPLEPLVSDTSWDPEVPDGSDPTIANRNNHTPSVDIEQRASVQQSKVWHRTLIRFLRLLRWGGLIR